MLCKSTKSLNKKSCPHAAANIVRLLVSFQGQHILEDQAKDTAKCYGPWLQSVVVMMMDEWWYWSIVGVG